MKIKNKKGFTSKKNLKFKNYQKIFFFEKFSNRAKVLLNFF